MMLGKSKKSHDQLNCLVFNVETICNNCIVIVVNSYQVDLHRFASGGDRTKRRVAAKSEIVIEFSLNPAT